MQPCIFKEAQKDEGEGKAKVSVCRIVQWEGADCLTPRSPMLRSSQNDNAYSRITAGDPSCFQLWIRSSSINSAECLRDVLVVEDDVRYQPSISPLTLGRKRVVSVAVSIAEFCHPCRRGTLRAFHGGPSLLPADRLIAFCGGKIPLCTFANDSPALPRQYANLLGYN